MGKKIFSRFSFVDESSMEVIIIYEDERLKENVDKFTNWIMKEASRKLSNDIIILTRMFGQKHLTEIAFNENESTFLMIINYELFKEYVSFLNEKMILHCDK